MPTAETTLFPAYSTRSKRLLTSSVRLDNEANLIWSLIVCARRPGLKASPCERAA